jgi:cytochrome c oxidase subunit 3
MATATEHGVRAHHFDTLDQQRTAATLGMWLFLATEVLVFGAVFTSYAVYRMSYPHDFEAASQRLNILIAAINTVVLLTSSLTMALSVYATRVGRRSMLLTCLILTAVLGGVFLVFKVVGYHDDYVENLVPALAFDGTAAQWSEHAPPVNPQHVQLMLIFYYVLTGLHAVHLTIGIGQLIWLIAQARLGQLTPQRSIPVEVVGLYWHFVDVVWIFLRPLLYLTGTHHLADLHF